MRASLPSATRSARRQRARADVSNSVVRQCCERPASVTPNFKLLCLTLKSAPSLPCIRLPFRHLVLSALLIVLAGCVTLEEKANAIRAVNADFRKAYEQIIKEQGTTVFNASEAQAFAAMKSCLKKLGRAIETQDSSVGYLRVAAPAPTPLTREEWQRAGETDLPRMRKIVKEQVGFMGGFIKFEPEGLDIVINITTIQKSPGRVELSASMRMREVTPPKGSFPRREYPPPTAVRMGIAKIWSQFDTELTRIKANQ